MIEALLTIVYSFGGSILAPLPPERVLATDPAWITVPDGWAMQVTLQDGDVICAEAGTSRECGMARLGRWPFAGLVAEVKGPARLEVLGCYTGGRKGRAYAIFDPSQAVGYHVAVHLPPDSRCWWNAWCAIGVGLGNRDAK